MQFEHYLFEARGKFDKNKFNSVLYSLARHYTWQMVGRAGNCHCGYRNVIAWHADKTRRTRIETKYVLFSNKNVKNDKKKTVFLIGRVYQLDHDTILLRLSLPCIQPTCRYLLFNRSVTL